MTFLNPPAAPSQRLTEGLAADDRDVNGPESRRTGAGHQAGPAGIREARRAIRPTGVERSFGADELIVSKTDPRGVITYANDVFLRVSDYPLAEVIGQPAAPLAAGDRRDHPAVRPPAGRGAAAPERADRRGGVAPAAGGAVAGQADDYETFVWSIMSREEH